MRLRTVLPLAAAAARIPFVVAGPTSTIDRDCPSGSEIEIEQRDAAEVISARGGPDGALHELTIADTPCRNPASRHSAMRPISSACCAPELELLEDPPRVADHLAVEDQDRHPPLPAEHLDLGPTRAALAHHDRLELDPLASQRASDLAARTQPVGRGVAAVERRHGAERYVLAFTSVLMYQY